MTPLHSSHGSRATPPSSVCGAVCCAQRLVHCRWYTAGGLPLYAHAPQRDAGAPSHIECHQFDLSPL
eukprot:6642471-Prymnesium_polylepis.1